MIYVKLTTLFRKEPDVIQQDPTASNSIQQLRHHPTDMHHYRLQTSNFRLYISLWETWGKGNLSAAAFSYRLPSRPYILQNLPRDRVLENTTWKDKHFRGVGFKDRDKMNLELGRERIGFGFFSLIPNSVCFSSSMLFSA